MEPELPFSQACENNKDPILKVLAGVFADCTRVLEIGSGTGQHATYFAEALPQLEWQPSELPGHLPYLLPRCERYSGNNLLAPIILDVRSRPWSTTQFDGLFTANTLHIMSLAAVEDFFAGLDTVLVPGARLAVYGPFNYGGRYTSPSNASFDQWLSERDPASAIRNFEFVDRCANESGLSLLEDNDMPANNRLLVWQKD